MSFQLKTPFQFKNTARMLHLLTTVGILSIIASTAAFTSTATASENPPVPTIQVSATGSAELAPDMAVLDLGVMREAKTAREALDANNRAMKGVIGALRETGIEEKDLQTANFNIQPRYDTGKSYSNGDRRFQIIGYTVSNSLTVRIRDLKILGTVLDKVVTLGVNSGGNVRLTNDDPSDAITRARTSAMKKAIAKAETLTKAAGAKLGEILSISEGAANRRPVAIAMARASFDETADGFVPLAAGENSYRVTVSVSWKIDQ